MSSHQILPPPAHGGAAGKFAPPATISASSCTPANGPATPGCLVCPADGGNGGRFSHFKFVTRAWAAGSTTRQVQKNRRDFMSGDMPVRQAFSNLMDVPTNVEWFHDRTWCVCSIVELRHARLRPRNVTF